MSPADFMGTLFLARDVAHRAHLTTLSHSKHRALQNFYESVVEMADKFAETYQGRNGIIQNIPLMSVKKPGNALSFLQSQLEEIEQGRFEVADEKDTPLQNIIDEIVGLYLQTIYKLKFLA